MSHTTDLGTATPQRGLHCALWLKAFLALGGGGGVGRANPTSPQPLCPERELCLRSNKDGSRGRSSGRIKGFVAISSLTL